MGGEQPGLSRLRILCLLGKPYRFHPASQSRDQVDNSFRRRAFLPGILRQFEPFGDRRLNACGLIPIVGRFLPRSLDRPSPFPVVSPRHFVDRPGKTEAQSSRNGTNRVKQKLEPGLWIERGPEQPQAQGQKLRKNSAGIALCSTNQRKISLAQKFVQPASAVRRHEEHGIRKVSRVGPILCRRPSQVDFRAPLHDPNRVVPGAFAGPFDSEQTRLEKVQPGTESGDRFVGHPLFILSPECLQ